MRARGWFKDRLFRLLFKNVGVLVSGDALSSLFGLGYLALTTRALGAWQFGVLVLMRSSLFLVHTCSPKGFSNNFIQAWLRGAA